MRNIDAQMDMAGLRFTSSEMNVAGRNILNFTASEVSPSTATGIVLGSTLALAALGLSVYTTLINRGSSYTRYDYQTHPHRPSRHALRKHRNFKKRGVQEYTDFQSIGNILNVLETKMYAAKRGRRRNASQHGVQGDSRHLGRGEQAQFRRKEQGEVHQVQGEVHGGQGQVHEVQGEVHEVQGEVHGDQGEVHEVQGEVHGGQGEVHGDAGEIHGGQGQVHEVQGAVHEVHEVPREPRRLVQIAAAGTHVLLRELSKPLVGLPDLLFDLVRFTMFGGLEWVAREAGGWATVLRDQLIHVLRLDVSVLGALLM